MRPPLTMESKEALRLIPVMLPDLSEELRSGQRT